VLVSSVRQAVKAEQTGASSVIAVGQEGGGFIGRDDTGTISLTPAVVDAVSIPVVAAGGLADARGILAALALGAEGVEMGTRFVTVAETRAEEGHKHNIVRAGDTGTAVLVTERYRIRVIRKQVDGDEVPAEGWGAGQSAGLIGDVPTVAELFARFEREIGEGNRRLGSMIEE
jgi:enoyl-[acyl-carrier protein] reductase II